MKTIKKEQLKELIYEQFKNEYFALLELADKLDINTWDPDFEEEQGKLYKFIMDNKEYLGIQYVSTNGRNLGALIYFKYPNYRILYKPKRLL